MSEVEPQSPVDTVRTEDTVSETVDTSSQAEPEPHDEHEVEPIELEKPAEETPADTAVPVQSNGDNKTNGTEHSQSDDVLTVEDLAIPPAEEGKKEEPATTAETGKPKTTMSVKTTGSKSAGPPTPLVKKILNSGTFGAGSVKTAPASKAISGIAASAANKATTASSALKKSVSAGPPASSPTKPTAITKAPSTGTTATGPARRASVVPPRPAASSTSKQSMPSSTSKPPLSSSTSKPPLASSTSSKPTSATSKPTTAARSVVSPAGSTSSVKSSANATRPRASVSEGVKKAPLAGRQSLAGSTKPPPATKAPVVKPAGTKPNRTTGSISSIREVREDGKALEELQAKLKEANESLSSKTEAAKELQIKVDALESSLETAQGDVEAKRAAVEQLEQAKSASEAELTELKVTLEKLQSEDSASALTTVQEQLQAAKASSAAQTELIQNLQAQISALELELAAAKTNLDSLQASHALASSDAAAAAQVDRDGLVKAKSDLDAIATETAALKVAHTAALDEATAKLKDYESNAIGIEALERELSELKKEKEDAASKISELEIEILELKESQENAEDTHAQLLGKVKALEEELANAVAATQRAIDDANAKDTEHLQRTIDDKAAHDEELRVISEEQAKAAANLEVLKEELAAAQAAHEQAKSAAQVVSDDYTRKLAETERLHLGKQGELTEQINKITADLESQEAQYNAKVDVVKAEHAKLLQEAFERAKNEAGELHGQDLQGLRAESQATIEQLRTAHQSTIDDMKNEHALLLDSQVKTLEKQISNQSLELKATQDDLVKAKASLEASRAEVENLAAQRDEAKVAALAGAAPDPAIAEEIERLTKELSHAKDDVNATQEALTLTKQSLSEVTENQAKELEEAAKGRAEEVTRLKAAHEEEVSTLVGQKSELATKLSDLEGDLATLKASVSEQPASPKANGTNGNVQPSSPGVTKEELQSMHEAHNAKMHDLQAEHDKALKAVKESLELAQTKAEELQQEVARKTMEIQYLEQEQEESSDQITRLKEDMTALSDQLKAKEA